MFQIRLLRVVIVFFIILLSFNVAATIYLFNIQREIIKEDNIENISRRIMRIQYRHQKEEDIVYFILPESYASEDIDNYVEEYGNKHDLKLRKVFFNYHCAIYEFQNNK